MVRLLVPTVLALAIALLPSSAMAAINDSWITFFDSETGAECDVINASNAELILLAETGYLVAVSGGDIVLEDLVVNANNQVSYLGEPAGFIEYAEDGDGLATVFWTSLAGTVVTLNTFTGEPTDSGRTPDEFRSTSCDACLLIDESDLCESTTDDDDDDSGIEDEIADNIAEFICGTGSPFATSLSLILLPVLGFVHRRRY